MADMELRVAPFSEAPETAVAICDRAFEDSPVGMAIFDEAYRFLRVNAALAEIFEGTPEELLGRPYRDLVHPDQHAAMEARMRASDAGTLRAGEVERRFLTLRGAGIWLRASGVRTSEEPVRYFGVFVDVTAGHAALEEQARLQEQVLHAERLRTLGQVAAGIVHEINNPTSIALGGVDLARRRVAAALTAARAGDLAGVRKQLDQMETALRYCEAGALRVAEATSRLGAFTSLRAGSPATIDLNECVRRAVGLVRNELRHCATLDLDLGESRPFVGYCDRLVQVCTQLLLNAGQAVSGPPETQRIVVRTWSEEEAACVSVRDTGTGMSREVRARIFEPFFSSRGRERGTGLGLTVAEQVVRQHGGTIDVTSEPGQGACFTLRLPYQNGLVAEADAHGQGGRVLVIDDEPHIVAVLAEILGDDHEVVTADGGRAALALLAEDRSFSVVLCDLMMPEIDGVEVHAWLAHHAPDLAARTVFMTGGAFTPRAESYLERCARPVLEKPFTSDQVRRRVASQIQK